MFFVWRTRTVRQLGSKLLKYLSILIELEAVPDFHDAISDTFMPSREGYENENIISTIILL